MTPEVEQLTERLLKAEQRVRELEVLELRARSVIKAYRDRNPDLNVLPWWARGIDMALKNLER